MPKLILALLLCCSFILCHPSETEIFDSDPTKYFWDLIDIDGNNLLEASEYENFMVTLMGDQVDDHSTRLFYKLLDRDRDNTITLNEFKSALDPLVRTVDEMTPQQIHISLTGIYGEMRVMWITREKGVKPVIKYGFTESELSKVIPGSSTTYDIGVDGWKGWIHTAVIQNIPSSASKIHYMVGEEGSYSEIYTFNNTHTLEGKPIRLAVYGDMGTVPFGWKVSGMIQRSMELKRYDGVVHMGDISYASDGRDYEIQFLWDYFGHQIESIASSIPYMTGVGNHEGYMDFLAFRKRYLMPENGHSNYWWSFDIGLAHFTMVSSEHDFEFGSVQYKWIEQDLAKANANRHIRPWIFVTSHKAMYATSKSRYESTRPGAPFQRALEPLLQKYQVDMMFSGHNHNYERTWPTFFGTPKMDRGNYFRNPKAPIWVVQGTAGPITNAKWTKEKPEWNAVQLNYYGFGCLTLHNSTTLQYEFIDAMEGNVVDEFWIRK